MKKLGTYLIPILLIVILMNGGSNVTPVLSDIHSVNGSTAIKTSNNLYPTYNKSATYIFKEITQKIQNKFQKLGSGLFPSSPGSPLNFYGLAGEAGVGLNLLKNVNAFSSVIDTKSRQDAIQLAESIGNDLLKHTSFVNSTHVYWTISNNDTNIDLSLDFGLSGIAAFYGLLYNMTNNVLFKNTTLKLIHTIASEVYKSGKIHWNSTLANTLQRINWYPNVDFKFSSSKNLTLNGIGLGVAGVTDLTLKLQTFNISNSEVKSLFNDSLTYLLKQLQFNGTENFIPVSSQTPNLVATGYADGQTGFFDLFSRIQNYNSTLNLTNVRIGLLNWLNGTTSGNYRVDTTWWNVSEPYLVQKEFGMRYGIIGTLSILDTYSNFLNITGFSGFDFASLFNLQNVGFYSGNKFLYPEREVNGEYLNLSNYSYEFGAGGALSIFNQLANKYSFLQGFAQSIKLDLMSKVINNGSLYFLTGATLTENYNPFVGFVSIPQYIYTSFNSKFTIQSNTLNFGNQKINDTTSRGLLISTQGDKNISLSYNLTGSPSFKLTNAPATLIGWETAQTVIQFTPSHEKIEIAKLVLTIQFNSSYLQKYSIDLSGVGFDNPIIHSLTLQNDSIVKGTVEFNFSITDPSGILVSEYQIFNNKGPKQIILSGQMNSKGSDLYKIQFDSTKVLNGTYTLIVYAKDNLNHFSSQIFQFKVDNPVQSSSRPFTNEIAIIIGASLGLALAVAIILTKKYMS